MKKRTLGKSGLHVSVLALGCWALSGGAGWGDQDESESIATIHAALDHGINFFDTAEGYGNGDSELVVGKALANRRDQAFIATKVSPDHARPSQVRQYLEASLRRLQTDYLDLYMLHWPVATHPVADTMAVLQTLKQEGKVRSIGLSNFGSQQLAQVLQADVQVDANQLCYNLLSRAIEFEVLPMCRANQISVTTYMPLQQGILAGKWLHVDDIPPFRTRTRHFRGDRPGARHGEPGAEAEVVTALEAFRQIAADLNQPMSNVALAWVAARPGVTSVIAGARTPEQVSRNTKAVDLRLSSDVIARLDQATEALKLKLGADIDYWQGKENSRSR